MGAECKNSKQCAPAKHHFDECVERVTNASDDEGEKEDCVEECEYLLSSFPLKGVFHSIRSMPYLTFFSPWLLSQDMGS